MDKKSKKEVEHMIQSVGAMAEMGLIFYQAAVGVGADAAEATRLTQAYFAAMLFGNQQKPPESEEG